MYREDGTVDIAIYEEFFKRNAWMIVPFFLWELLVLNGSIVPKNLWMRAK